MRICRGLHAMSSSGRLILPRRYSRRILYACTLTLVSVASAAHNALPLNFCLAVAVFCTSINYWRHPVRGSWQRGSWRRSVDMLVAVTAARPHPHPEPACVPFPLAEQCEPHVHAPLARSCTHMLMHSHAHACVHVPRPPCGLPAGASCRAAQYQVLPCKKVAS